MQKAIFVFFSLTYHLHTWAQTGATGEYIKSDYFSNLVPKESQVSALGSFGNIPVNYYTCHPEVSIPLMTLSSRDLSLPVSINYDASGVKTDDMSGQVGLKWNLNAGGFIYRGLNGLPDEHPSKGYLKYALSTNYWNDITEISDWVIRSEKNFYDCHPDQFVINVNGRSINFVFDKFGVAHSIPRQNVKISYTKLNDKIHRFILTTEDGTIYEFGGDDTSIEQKKIERLSTRLTFRWDPTREIADNVTKRSYYSGEETFSKNFDNDEKEAIDWFNSKWFLKKITSASGDQLVFTYQKGVDVKYALKPSVTRVSPVLVQLSYYKTKLTECGGFEVFGDCLNGEVSYDWVHPGDNELEDYDGSQIENSRFLLAIREFRSSDPGSAPNNSDNAIPIDAFERIYDPSHYPYQGLGLKQSEGNYYLAPEKHFSNPGGVMVSHVLVNESNIRLISVESVTGNKLQFSSSLRSDLPNSFKYDEISLYNSQSDLVKKVKLSYSTIDADVTSNDLFWVSEAVMMSKISNLVQPGPSYYAYFAKSFDESKISNPHFLKYVYEGLKDYNYKRLFLEAITEENVGGRIPLYKFEYENRGLLKRRTTPVCDVFGFPVDNPKVETLILETGKTAQMTKGYVPNLFSNGTPVTVPTTGILERIFYPTKGSTEFSYKKNWGPLIEFIKDLDESGNVLSQKQIKNLSNPIGNTTSITTSYQEFKTKAENQWIKTAIVSSSPQNDFPLFGSIENVPHVRVYNGTESNHKGYEEFKFISGWDEGSGNVNTIVLSMPKDLDKTGNFVQGWDKMIFPFPRQHNREHLRGMLKEHIVFNANGDTVKIVNNFYSINPDNYLAVQVQGFTGGSFIWTSSTKQHWYGTEYEDNEWRRRFGRYKITADWILLSKTVETLYADDRISKFTVVKENKFDQVNLQLIESKTYCKELPDQQVITKTKYATHSDYNYSNNANCQQQYLTCREACMGRPEGDRSVCISNCVESLNTCQEAPLAGASPEVIALIALRNKHQISSPVEIQTLAVETSVPRIISSIVFKYAELGTTTKFVKPKEIWGLERKLELSNFITSKAEQTGILTIDNKMRKLHTFDSYNSSANLLQQTSIDGITSQYQWSSNGELVTGFILNPGSSNYSYQYEHKPLVGMISTTDPNGRKSFYDFDSFGRLWLTKDHDGNILSRQRYHYKSDTGLNNQITGNSLGVTGQALEYTSADNLPYGRTSYEWNFGDGTPITNGSSVSHTYSLTGSYTISLKKVNPEYGSITVTKALKIVSPGNLQINTSGSLNIDICASNQLPTFFASVTGGCTNYSFVWEYRTSQNPNWTYYKSGASIELTPSTSVGAFEYRCVVSGNPCNDQIVSSSIYVTFYKSNPSCAIGR